MTKISFVYSRYVYMLRSQILQITNYIFTTLSFMTTNICYEIHKILYYITNRKETKQDIIYKIADCSIHL